MHKKIGLISIFLLIFVIGSLWTLQFGDQTPKVTAQSIPNRQSGDEKDVRSTFPVTLKSGDRGQPISEDEKRKSAKYDRGMGGLSSDPDIPSDIEGAVAIDWGEGLSALPIERSTLIFVGKVVDAKAHLSNKKNSVYSEFKIEIESVLKNVAGDELEKKGFVMVEREGGRVKYPSGHEYWFRFPKQAMPTVGGRYLLFVTDKFPIYGRQEKDLYLLTGYELRDGLVSPLDRLDGSHPLMSTYSGKEESKLLGDLREALKGQ